MDSKEWEIERKKGEMEWKEIRMESRWIVSFGVTLQDLFKIDNLIRKFILIYSIKIDNCY